jgi:PAS domain S-box-containing protein
LLGADEQLRESEQRSRPIVETIVDAAIAFDDDGVVLLFSPAAEKMFRCRAGEAIGRSVKALIPDCWHGRFDAHIANALRAAEGRTIGIDHDLAGRRKDGSTFPMQLVVGAFLIDGHRAFVATARAVTEHTGADEDIHRSAAVLIDSNDAMAVHDLDGRITAWNRGAVRMYGYTPAEALAMNVTDMVSAAARDEAKALLGRLADGEEVGSFETQRVTKDGRALDIWLTLTMLRDDAGRPIAVATTERDVTERNRTERELRDSEQRLRSLTFELALAEERERRRIATGLHDQIGGTLAAVRIRLSQLRQLPGAGPQLRQALSQIRDLIETTIDSSRSLTFDLTSPVLYEVGLEAALDSLTNQMQEQHGIQHHFEDDGQPKPMTDELKVILYHTVRELLANVAKYAQAGSVFISIGRDGGSVRIRVEDDGVGFEVPKTGFHVSESGGFGLYHAGERMKHLGGRFHVESTAGQGTTVTIVVPLATASTVNDRTAR